MNKKQIEAMPVNEKLLELIAPQNLKVKRADAYLIPNGNKLPFRPKGKVFYMENKEPKENY